MELLFEHYVLKNPFIELWLTTLSWHEIINHIREAAGNRLFRSLRGQ